MKAFYIFVKELRGYLTSPISFCIAAVFLLITGYLFSLNLLITQRVDFFPHLVSAMVFVMLFITPAFTPEWTKSPSTPNGTPWIAPAGTSFLSAPTE